MKSGKRRLLLILLSAAVVFTMVPLVSGLGKAYADSNGEVGRLNGTSYYSFKELTKALENNHKNRRVTIDVMCNWNAAGSDDFDRHIVIPEGCTAALSMHGYVINRNRAFRNNSDSDGEVICMEKGSTLEIFGGYNEKEKSMEHPLVATYSSTNSSQTANKSITTYGGTITGGCGSYGSGGIHMKGNCKLVLNDVTIAGCGTRGIGVYGGLGGGIYMRDGNSKVIMNDSTITGCFADVDGGGIYANGEPESIELNNSSIDRNYAEDNGGGIYTNNQKVSVSGRNSARVINNEAGGYGGGICVWYGECSVSGLTISGNKAKKGGGVHLDSKEISLSNLIINKNRAERGGGVAVHKDQNTISGCEITDNGATISGGGVYVDSDVDEGFTVAGKTIIRGNSGHNFYFSDNDPTDTRCDFKLTKGSDVHVSYWDTKDKDSIMVTNGKVNDTIKTPNCIQYLHSDDSNYHFNYNDAPNQKKIYFVRNGKSPSGSGTPYEEPPAPTQIPPDKAINSNNDNVDRHGDKAGVVGKVKPGGDVGDTYENTYNLIRGFTRHEETDDDANDSSVCFYYSDAFFDDDPYKYNDQLATASLNMAYAGMYLRAKEEEDDSGNYYYNRHAAGRQFMADIGCPDQKIYVNDSNENKPQTDSIGVTIASKELAKANGDKTGYTLIPIVVRGGGYELEWASNATLNRASDMYYDGKKAEARGFSNAADQVMNEIELYIDAYGLRDEVNSSKVKFWISGYSRAGATSNITAKRLIEKYADGSQAGKNNQVFAYTCEAPMGGTDLAEKLTDKTKYYCIHNLINAVDIVPLVAPELMGFKRYGVDHYIPGGEAGAVKKTTIDTSKRSGENGPQTATTYKDNEWIYIKNASSSLKGKMKAQLRAVDSGIVLDDYYHPMVMDVAPSIKFYEDGDYAGNHIEWFVRDFIRFAQVGKWEGRNDNYMKAIPNRTYFAENIQQPLRDTLALVMTMDADTSQGFIGRASSIMDRISTIGGDVSKLDIYFNVITGWNDLSKADKEKYYTSLWSVLVQTGALDFLDDSEQAKLQKNWPTLANMAFTIVHADEQFHPSLYKANPEIFKPTSWANGAESTSSIMLLGTFATYSTFILQNHYPEVNLAWARAYDDYYAYETTEYETQYQGKASGYSVNKPSAEIGEMTLEEGEKKANTLRGGDQIVTLEVDDIAGEAIYYDLTDNTNGRKIASNKLYRGGVGLTRGTAPVQSYTLTAYAISYGVRSEKAVYNINYDSRHKVTVREYTGAWEKDTYYQDGDEVKIVAAPMRPDQGHPQYFKEWKVRLTDAKGETIEEDITDSLLGESKTMAVAEFTMPETNEEAGYPEGYGLVIEADCGYMVTQIIASPGNPGEGDPLPETIPLRFRANNQETDDVEYPVAWTYEDGAGNIVAMPDGIPAYGNTRYYATITIPQDQENGIVFAPVGKDVFHLSASIRGSSATAYKVSRNEADGSVELIITYMTGSDPFNPNPRPDGFKILNCGIWDENRSDYDSYQEMKIVPNHVMTLTAPGTEEEDVDTDNDIETMRFDRWDFDENEISRKNPAIRLYGNSKPTDRTIKVFVYSDYKPNSGTETDIDALYKPAVNAIHAEVNIPEEETQDVGTDPVGGQVISDKTKLFVTIKNTYRISEESYEVIWSPEFVPAEAGTKKADHLTAYTVTFRLKGDLKATKIDPMTHDPVGEEQTLTGEFAYANHISASINGYDATVNAEDNSLCFTFPETKYNLLSVEQPEDLDGVEHGKGEEEIKALLPKFLGITVEEGGQFNVPVSWNLEKGEQDDPRDAVTWTATASIELPGTVEDRDRILDTPVTMKVHVDEAEHAAAPEATLESGTYLYDQSTMLTTNEEGGKIYYTLDGSNPAKADNQSRREYAGGYIDILREDANIDETVIDEDTGEETATGRKMIVLKACTEVEGKFDSTVATYGYVFDDEVPLPEGEALLYNTEEQVGLPSSVFYTVDSVSGSGEVKDGNAVATNAGTYEVTLHVADGMKWKLPEGATDEDQIVEFTIDQLDLSIYGKIAAADFYDTLKELREDIKVTVDGNVIPAAEYDISLSKVSNRKVTVTVTGKGINCIGETSGVVATAAKDQKGDDGTPIGPDASEDAADDEIKNLPGEDDPAGSYFNPLRVRSVKQGKTNIKLKWKKPKAAVRYVIYGSPCGKKTKYMRLTTSTKSGINIKKINGKKLKKTTYYKFIVVALNKDGNVVSTSRPIHAATKGNLKKAANPKKVIVKAKVNAKGKKIKKYKKISRTIIKKGKTIKLKASYTKPRKSKVRNHVGLKGMRFESSNTKIATVTKKGTVKARAKGKCYIYVYAQNGVFKKVKITVK